MIAHTMTATVISCPIITERVLVGLFAASGCLERVSICIPDHRNDRYSNRYQAQTTEQPFKLVLRNLLDSK
jgi:hypothetical protein